MIKKFFVYISITIFIVLYISSGLYAEDGNILEQEKETLYIGETEAVVSDIFLPTEGKDGTEINWMTSDEEILSTDGTVNRPEPGQGEAEVTLTAEIIRENESVTRDFELKVLEDEKVSQLESINIDNIIINDEFWRPIQERVINTTIPHGIEQVQIPQYGVHNIVNAAKKLRGENHADSEGYVFQESDVHKLLEAMNYALEFDPRGNEEIKENQEIIRNTLDEWIPYYQDAQEESGYFNAYYTLNPQLEKWSNMSDHELYSAGHFIEAAVTNYKMTDGEDERLYEVAVKLADYIDSKFGSTPKWKNVPGHQEIELALIKLARLVDEVEGQGKGDKYRNLSKFFINGRGDTDNRHVNYNGGEYSQDHLPVREQDEGVGHAVRALYMYSGITDVAVDLDDYSLLEPLQNLWNNVTNKKMYITGGIGARGGNEGFGYNYELPNRNSYSETCAAIANVFWNQRMNKLFKDAKYVDVLEKSLYNNVLVGLSLSGDRFNYRNPLENQGNHIRQPWYDCACCPPNIMRILMSIDRYIYNIDDESIYVNLFIGSEADINLQETAVELIQKTNYPWEGDIKIEVNPEVSSEFDIKVRIPDWSNEYNLKVNDEKVADSKEEVENGYVVLNRNWNKGDIIELDLPMEPVRQRSHPEVAANRDKIALQRGPIVYSLESNDNPESPLSYVIEPDVELETEFRPDLLDGVQVITGTGKNGTTGNYQETDFTAIPYYAWNNRGRSEMTVWVREVEEEEKEPTIASKAETKVSHVSPWESKEALNSQFEPMNSHDRGDLVYGNWPEDETQWVQYNFDREYTISATEVYWFEDGDGLLLPSSWRALYWDGSDWQEVKPRESEDSVGYGLELNQFNKAEFAPVTTDKFRLEIESGEGSTGILEWKVHEHEDE